MSSDDKVRVDLDGVVKGGFSGSRAPSASGATSLGNNRSAGPAKPNPAAERQTRSLDGLDPRRSFHQDSRADAPRHQCQDQTDLDRWRK